MVRKNYTSVFLSKTKISLISLNKRSRSKFYLLSVIWVAVIWVFAQKEAEANSFFMESVQNEQAKINVFFDCDDCDFNYIKKQIEYINYVRDKEIADVHVFITENSTGSGGSRYTVQFIGQGRFASNNYTIEYIELPTDTESELRAGLASTINAGLITFLVETKLLQPVEIRVQNRNKEEPEENTDKWDGWIFEISVGGEIQKESTQSELNGDANFEANRIKEKWRTRSEFEYDYEKQNIETSEGVVTSLSNYWSFDVNQVRSISSHWSTGVFYEASSSTYRNQRFQTSLNAAIEYNVYPYSEVSFREFTFAYFIGPSYVDYFNETIYLRNTEFLPRHQFQMEMRFNQPWGEARWDITASEYLNDLSKYSIDFYGRLSYRITKGLSFRISANFEIVRDQLYLSRQEATLEELLLKQRKIKTDYESGFFLGVSYTFGSIYNNIVNTRL